MARNEPEGTLLAAVSPSIVRRFEPRDREGFARVRSLTYRGGEAVDPTEDLLKDDCRGYVAEMNGQIVGAYTALDMTCNVDGTHLPCAGVAAVAVNPELRKSGVGSELLTQGLRLMKEDGFAFASLYAFRETYYRRFGYEVCGGRFLITVPGHRLPKVDSDLPVRLASDDELPGLIEPIYRKFARRWNGMNERTPRMWWRTLGGDTRFKVYVMGDPAEAYAVVRLRFDFWEAQEVKEVAWASERGYRAILGLFSRLGINKSEVAWNEPTASPFLATYMDQGITVTNQRFVMYRALDPVRILNAKKPNGGGEIRLNLTDGWLPENNLDLDVSFSPEGLEVEARPRSRTPKLALPICRFTQVALGEPSYASLAANGIVPESEDAERLFAPRAVFCADAF